MEKETVPSNKKNITSPRSQKRPPVVVIKIPEVVPDNSYAAILKGDQPPANLTGITIMLFFIIFI